jgi:hypothetical protein
MKTYKTKTKAISQIESNEKWTNFFIVVVSFCFASIVMFTNQLDWLQISSKYLAWICWKATCVTNITRHGLIEKFAPSFRHYGPCVHRWNSPIYSSTMGHVIQHVQSICCFGRTRCFIRRSEKQSIHNTLCWRINALFWRSFSVVLKET